MGGLQVLRLRESEGAYGGYWKTPKLPKSNPGKLKRHNSVDIHPFDLTFSIKKSNK
jgi:hypothetical protein